MPVRRRAWRPLCAAATPLLVPVPLHAAETAAATAAATADPGPALGEIVVTAERRRTDLQKTPIAITAFSAGALADRKVDSIRDLAGQIPNLRIPRATIGYTTQLFSLRGVGETDPIQEPTVSVYVDDVYYPRQIGSMLDFNDVERIEVLRGPQGTLYGRNTSAGAVRVLTADPGDRTRMAADIGYGSYDALRARALASGAIVPGRLYASLAYTHYTRDGTHRDPTLGRRVNGIGIDALRGKLRWTPAATTDVQLTLDGLRDRSDARSYTPVAQPGGRYRSLVSYSELDPRNDLDQGGAALRIRQQLGDHWEIKSVTARRAFDQHANYENDGTAQLIQKNIIHYTDSYWTQELQANGHYDRLTLTGGVFYFHERFGVDRDGYTRTGPRPTSPVNKIGDVNTTTTDSVAVFGQAGYRLTDALTLTAGLRATRERKRFDFRSNTIDDAGSVAAVRFAGDAQRRWNALTPKLAVDWQLGRSLLAYASYTQGFKAGGFDNRASTVADAARGFDPEKVRTYEGGVKTELFGRRLRVNLAGFYNDYRDLQVASYVPALARQVRTNAARAETYGVEVETTARLTANLTVSGSAGWLTARYRSFAGVAGAGTDASGNDLVNAPRWTGSGAIDWTVPIGVPGRIHLGADAQYQSSIYTNALNRPQDRIGTSVFVNGLIRWDAPDDRWAVSLAVKNILDDRTAQGSTFTPSTGIYYLVTGDPRTALATVSFSL